jgi:hypothetical protein
MCSNDVWLRARHDTTAASAKMDLAAAERAKEKIGAGVLVRVRGRTMV